MLNTEMSSIVFLKLVKSGGCKFRVCKNNMLRQFIPYDTMWLFHKYLFILASCKSRIHIFFPFISEFP